MDSSANDSPPKAPSKREQNREIRRKKLQSIALAAYVERGINSVSVDDIVRGAGVGKGTFYRHFRNQAALVESLLEPFSQHFDRAIAQCEATIDNARGRDDLFAAYEGLSFSLIGVGLQNIEVVRLYLQESRGPRENARVPIRELSDKVQRAALRLTEAAHRHQLLVDLPASITGLAVVGSVETLLFSYLEGQKLGSMQDASRALTKMVLDGIRNRASLS